MDYGFKSHLDVTPSAPELLLPPPPAPEKKVPGTVAKIEAETAAPEKLKVSAYCRVSSLLDNQEGSIINQQEHYETYIRSNPEWEKKVVAYCRVSTDTDEQESSYEAQVQH